jgi:excisionase family DNA binding protein
MRIPELFTTEELMARFKVTRRWVEMRVAEGELHPIKFGRLNRFTEADITSYLARRNPGLISLDDDEMVEEL